MSRAAKSRPAAAATVQAARVAAVRHFNRFYTQKIGVLRDRLLQSPFSLAQVRVLYELAHQRDVVASADATALTASRLALDLGLDAGYLSRILKNFEKQGLIRRKVGATDGRQYLLSLTRAGERAFAPLEQRSRDEVAALLAPLSASRQRSLTDAMRAILTTLGDASKWSAAGPITLRSLRAGDIGWIVHRHGLLYAREYGYDQRFEALVSEIAARFVQHFNARGERCWIAERDGAIVGSVFVVRQTPTVAKLRLLLVEPSARGVGLGRRLVNECVRFARQAGYRKLVLWTQSELVAARSVYERAGFVRKRSEAHYSFGRDLIAETWEFLL